MTKVRRGGAVTTVTFEETGGKTLLVMRDLYPSKEALDGAIASGVRVGWARRSNNWTSFSSPWTRAWDGHEAVDHASPRADRVRETQRPKERKGSLLSNPPVVSNAPSRESRYRDAANDS
jgi:hypothetical protein